MKLALFGCGKQAPKHISGLRAAGVDDILLVDTQASLAQALGEEKSLAWTDDPQRVWGDPAIDAISICTPTPSHDPLIRAALEAGKDVFCEKPLCETTEQARELAALIAAQESRLGMVGYIYRFAPVFEQMQHIIQAGVLGRVTAAQFRIGGRGSHQLWKHRLESGGGAVNEMLVHMLDLAIWFFGPVVESRCLIKDLRRPKRLIRGQLETVDAEDYVLAQTVMEDGSVVLIQGDLLTPAFSQSIEIQGEYGSLMGSIQNDRPSVLFLTEKRGQYEAGATPLQAGESNLFRAQMQAFVTSVKTRTPPDRSTFDDSLKVMEALEPLQAAPITPL